MKFLLCCFFIATLAKVALPAPADGFVFPDDVRSGKKLEPIITPPVLPVLEHLERDPSTLINEPAKRTFPSPVKPRFFGGGFNVAPSGNGGLTASVSSSGSAGSASHSASQSFSFGFNEGFGASQSASQSSSFGFGGFSGSQASSQSASFSGPGGSASGAASSASSVAGSFGSGSQSASQSFGFNSALGGFGQSEPTYDNVAFDVRHRGVPNFPFPGFLGRGKSVGAASFRKGPTTKGADDFVSVFISN
ncbi:nuclear pore complex protein Nup214 [Amyelois transitella]|uniref:nuclear pore complex protein Nup214 n=1 Tax=Amyelois transitella TaxID=680683 RepID=UPI0029901856|nr:nuclear pore complex protein Nup214 [Amyelois transitella]